MTEKKPLPKQTPRELLEKTAEAIAREKDRPVSEVGADDERQAKEALDESAPPPESDPHHRD